MWALFPEPVSPILAITWSASTRILRKSERLSAAKFRSTNRDYRISCARTSNKEGYRSQPHLRSPFAAADAVFIAVGTPSRRGDGHADLSYVYDAAREIAAALDGFTVVITKSTVPVGTGDEVERIIHEARPDADVAVVANPEFLREGAAIHDFKHPDRIVVGTQDERAKKWWPKSIGR